MNDSPYTYRNALSRAIRHETRGNGTQHPNRIDAVWAMREREQSKSNEQRRFQVIVGRGALTFLDRMTGRSETVKTISRI